MKTFIRFPSIAFLAVTSGLLLSACVAEPGIHDSSLDEEGVEEATSPLITSQYAAAIVPSFAGNPNIAAAAAQYLSPDAVVRAVLNTDSGLQIYQCTQSAGQQPAWTLRTPLAHVEPDANSLYALENPIDDDGRQVTSTYHYRSDFGAQLSPTELSMLGLANPPVNAPVWDVTFLYHGSNIRLREVVAGRVLAQDTVGVGNIANFFIEVRGRFATNTAPNGAVWSGVDELNSAIASADYMLRWNTTRGVPPESCTAATLGREVRVPYATQYYFIDNNPPPELTYDCDQACYSACYGEGACNAGICECWY